MTNPLTEPNELDTIYKMFIRASKLRSPGLREAEFTQAGNALEAYTNKQVVAKLNELLRAQPDVNWTNQEVTGETIHAVPVSVVEAAIATYTKSKETPDETS